MPSLRCLALFLLVTIATIPLHAGNKQMDEALERINASQKPEDALEPCLFIMAHATEAPAMQLLFASMVALANQRIEDAGFLFYAGQLRARFDMARYPPKGTGGDSPMVVLGALNQQIGGAVNPAIMGEPKAMAGAVKRIEAFKPATPKGYEPGWPYQKTDAAAGTAQFSEHHASFMRQMGGMSALLNDPEYFAAFKTVQTLNLSPDAKRAKDKAAAEAKMLAIEKKRDIEGVFYRRP